MGKLRDSNQSARPTFDPSSLDDEVARTTSWDPCKRGGASFCTRKLDRGGADRWQFRPTVGVIAFSLVFVGLGALSLGCCILARFSSWHLTNPGVMLTTGLLFACGGGFFLWSTTKPIVFDLKRGIHWKGRGEPGPEGKIELSNVHALQIISEYVARTRSDGGGFVSYELNLVLENGDRINVVDHGNYEQLRRDGHALSEVMEIPLWDPT